VLDAEHACDGCLLGRREFGEAYIMQQKTSEFLTKEISRCHDMTDKPFGVNRTFLSTFSSPPYPECIAAIRQGYVKAMGNAGRSPEQYMLTRSRPRASR
jgi:hypothetical protein